MQSSLKNLPRVSFILPTLNAEALLDNCLASIARQTCPRDRYEILIADAHSTDHTREIAKKYGAMVFDDDGKNMEEGKRLALRHATGEYIVFVDADNEITHPDYIELAVKALGANPQADLWLFLADGSRVFKRMSWRPKRDVTQIVSDVFEWVRAHERELKPFV